MNQVFGEAVKLSLDGRLEKGITFVLGIFTGVLVPKVFKGMKEATSKMFEETSKKANEIAKNQKNKKNEEQEEKVA